MSNPLLASSRAVFHGDGSVTLQLPGFAKHYATATEAAAAWHQFTTDGGTHGMEGHEPENADEIPASVNHRGGYAAVDGFTLDTFTLAGEGGVFHGWENVRDFSVEVHRLRNA